MTPIRAVLALILAARSMSLNYNANKSSRGTRASATGGLPARYAPPVCAYLHVQRRLLLQPQAPPILVAPPLFHRQAPPIHKAHTFVPHGRPPRRRSPRLRSKN